jgi:chromosome segregation ATPase
MFELQKRQIMVQHQHNENESAIITKVEQDWNTKLADLELVLREKQGHVAELQSRNQDLLSSINKACQDLTDLTDKLSLVQGRFEKLTKEVEERQIELNNKNFQLLELQNKLRNSLQGTSYLLL